MSQVTLPSIRSLQHVVTIDTTTPIKAYEHNRDRWAWHIENRSGDTLRYAKGRVGKAVSTSGETEGVPIANGAADGFDEFEAIDEVWIIGAAAGSVILHETLIPGWVEQFRLPGRL